MTNQLTVNENNQNQTIITQNAEGKFVRKAQYHAVCTVQATTKEEKIKLVNIMNGADESVIKMKGAIGAKITLANFMTTPYESVDEDTGELTSGVITTLFDVNGDVYVTSSKSVYFTLNNIFKVFAMPGSPDYDTLSFEVFEEKKGNSRNKSVDVRLIG